MDFLTQVLITVLNVKNATLNNVAFLAGITLTVGLVVFGILSMILGTFLSFILVAAVTAFFGYRTATTNEEMPVDERQSATTSMY